MLLLNKNASFIKNIKRLYFADKSIKNYNEFYKNTNFRHNKKLRRVDETSGTCQYSTEIGFKSFKPFASTSSSFSSFSFSNPFSCPSSSCFSLTSPPYSLYYRLLLLFVVILHFIIFFPNTHQSPLHFHNITITSRRSNHAPVKILTLI